MKNTTHVLLKLTYILPANESTHSVNMFDEIF